MGVIEHCDRCLEIAPPWDSVEYLEWHLGVDEDGEYLGVVCTGCFAGEGMSFIGIEARTSSARAARLSVVSSNARAGDEADSPPAMRTAA